MGVLGRGPLAQCLPVARGWLTLVPDLVDLARPAPELATRRHDIAGRDDLRALLADFYALAFRDDLLGPLFVDIARMDLDAHLPAMCDFWETVLFRTGRYRRNALHPHLRLHALAPLRAEHFGRWLMLWTATIDARHAGPKSELAKLQAQRIAGAMSRRTAGAEPTAQPPIQRARPANDPREATACG